MKKRARITVLRRKPEGARYCSRAHSSPLFLLLDLYRLLYGYRKYAVRSHVCMPCGHKAGPFPRAIFYTGSMYCVYVCRILRFLYWELVHMNSGSSVSNITQVRRSTPPWRTRCPRQRQRSSTF